ncbi:MAG: hypothetical protein JWM53_5278 [bacterium]|nr:hypothetical protein [bacterium]
MKRAILVAGVVLACALALPAQAYHAATHAGLTERAALASSLHAKLIQRFARALGLYEPLALDKSERDPSRRELMRRLGQLDPEGGLSPDRGRLSALGWLVAGAAIEGVPAERTRNHFFDPTRQSGLDEVGGEALRTRLRAAATGVGSVRGVFTGTAFDGSGMASTDWLRASDNEWGLQRFLDELERSAAAPTSVERDGALARALVAAGAIAHIVEDAGDPTLVRDDYRVALEADAGPYERFVVGEYGRVGVPELGGAAVAKSHLAALIHDGDGSGLADRTQSRFFSPGTLPDSGRYTRPQTTPGAAPSGYAAGAVPHLARYQRTERGVVWSLDERCFGDYARALLPETARYAAGALELLFRGRLDVAATAGAATVTVHDVALGRGKISLYADVGEGVRRLVQARDLTGAADGAAIFDGGLPAGTRHIAAVFRGVDAGGEPLVVVQETAVK